MDNAANSLHLRDASFSAYLSTAEENFAVKLAESSQSPYLPLTLTQEAPYPVNIGRTMAEEEGELRVFGAEKYFNMKMDDGRRRLATGSPLKHRQMKEDPADLPCSKPKIRSGTPSAFSEASWNSQTALLPRLLRNPSQNNKQRKVNARMIFAGFGCNGSCSDKKSVYVDSNAEPGGGIHGKEVRKKVAQNDLNPVVLDRTRLPQPGFPVKNDLHSRSFHKANTSRLNREEYYGCSVSISGPISLAVKGELIDKRAEEEGRKSIEVFGSHMLKKGDVATNLERKLSVLTWDAIPKAPTVPTTSEVTGAYEEDNESDGSSDLFEIENLSGSGHPLFNRQASDGGVSSCTRYEPSEASIEWSVVTASAADFSAASDFDEQKPVESAENGREVNSVRASKTKSMVGREAQRGRHTGLLGCRSDKAVKVSEPGCRTIDKAKSDSRWHHRLDSSMPLGKPQGENKVKDFEFPQAQHAFA